MKTTVLIAILLALLAIPARGQDVTWTVTSHSSTASLAVTGTSRAFVGELDSIHVYLPAATTATVSVAVAQPYGGPSTVIATNTIDSTYRVFAPRYVLTDVDGVAALTITNAGERIVMAGESLTATIDTVSTTNRPVLFRAVFKK